MEAMPPSACVAAILDSIPEYSAMGDAFKNIIKSHITTIALRLHIEMKNTNYGEWSSARMLLYNDTNSTVLPDILTTIVTAALDYLTNADNDLDPHSAILLEGDTTEAAKAAAHIKVRQLVACNANNQGDSLLGHQHKMTDSLIPRCHHGTDSRPANTQSGYTELPQKACTPLAPGHGHDAISADVGKESTPGVRIMTPEAMESRYVYKGPFAANGDRRHPSVIDHEARTGIKTVVGTGRDGRLTGYDIIMAATIVDNMPDHLKTTFMTDEEKARYEKEKAIPRRMQPPSVETNRKVDTSKSRGGTNATHDAKASEGENTNIAAAQQQRLDDNVERLDTSMSSSPSDSALGRQTLQPNRLVMTVASQSPTRGAQSSPDKEVTRSNSRPASPSPSGSLRNNPSGGDDINKPVAFTEEQYTVEAIVGHKTHNGRVYYNVKWEDYEDNENTWEPVSNLRDATNILNDYRASLRCNGVVDTIINHRKYQRYVEGRSTYIFEYMVKWVGFEQEFNSWEDEETIVRRKGKRPLIYYRIANNVAFGRGPWNANKQLAAIKLLQDEMLGPEPGGRISVSEVKVNIKTENEA